MQTKKTQQWAKTPTAEEIQQIIKEIDAKVKQAMADGNWPANQEPVYSLDNVVVHRSAVRAWDDATGWRKQAHVWGQLIMPPPYSPDLHQVVEHAIANMTTEFKNRMSGDLGGLVPAGRQERDVFKTVQDYFLVQVQCFQDANPAQYIKKNCDKLEKTYNEVIRLGGCYPAANLR